MSLGRARIRLNHLLAGLDRFRIVFLPERVHRLLVLVKVVVRVNDGSKLLVLMPNEIHPGTEQKNAEHKGEVAPLLANLSRSGEMFGKKCAERQSRD